MINDIIIDLWSFVNFASINDIKRKYNPIVDLSKFTSNQKILNGTITIGYNQVCSKILS